jgi:preprotein translocase subunit SecY
MHNSRPQLVQQQFANTHRSGIMGIACLTAGCVFLMWLGEQIDEYGLGNGISLIILAGIVARMPQALCHARPADQRAPTARRSVGQIVFLSCRSCSSSPGRS